jgi:PAS domain S-box-containing protein
MPRTKGVHRARRSREAPARPKGTRLRQPTSAEAELRISYDATLCGLVVLSPDWQVLRMNPAAEAILGWRLAELRERPLRTLWSAVREDGSPFATDEGPASAAMRSGEQVRNSVLGIRRRDGQRRNPHPSWVVDRETQAFLAVNDAALNHYGYTREEFLSMTARDLRPPEDVSAFVAELAGNAGSRSGRRWRHRKKDGTVIQVEVDSPDHVCQPSGADRSRDRYH